MTQPERDAIAQAAVEQLFNDAFALVKQTVEVGCAEVQNGKIFSVDREYARRWYLLGYSAAANGVGCQLREISASTPVACNWDEWYPILLKAKAIWEKDHSVYAAAAPSPVTNTGI